MMMMTNTITFATASFFLTLLIVGAQQLASVQAQALETPNATSEITKCFVTEEDETNELECTDEVLRESKERLERLLLLNETQQ
jgi:hypothetical protein